MPAPPALSGWFRSAYPSVTFNPDWVEPCVDYVQSSNPGIAGQALIKSVETQLLASDLSTSTFPPQQPHDPAAKLAFPTKTLVQLLSLDPVSHPAHRLLETLKEKREASKAGVDPSIAKKEEAEAGLPAQGWAPRQGGPGAGEDGPEEDKVGEYPAAGKGMARLVMSDGHSEFVGMEYKSLGEWCCLDQVKLGCKLMLHNVPQSGGVLLLGPQNCLLKGGDVQEIDAIKDHTLENVLRARLGMDPLPPPTDEPELDIKTDNAPPPAHPGPHPAPVKRESHVMTIASSGDDEPHARQDEMEVDDSFADDFDADAFAAMDEAEHAALSRGASNPAPAPSADSKPVKLPKPVKTVPGVSSHFGQAGTGARVPLQGGMAVRGSQGSSQDVKPRVGGSRGSQASGAGAGKAAVGGKRKVEVIDLLDSTDED